MSSVIARKKYKYEDYRKLPEGSPYQLIGGELVMVPSPTPFHQAVSRNLAFAIFQHVHEKGMGRVYYAPIDVYLGEEETYQPDIVFISNERLNIIGREKIEGTPDLVIEILSPATAYYDIRRKYRKYEEQGVREYWIVDPEERCIEVYVNEARGFERVQLVVGDGMVSSHILPGFEISLDDVFKP